MQRFKLSRRRFLQASAVGCGGLSLALSLGGCDRRAHGGAAVESFRPNAWLTISPDNSVTVFLAESEMGQGVMTSMPMLVAEELEADWETVLVRQAPIHPEYGWQGTGGSTSVRNAWEPLRLAGAAAREMLISAAAERWKVPRAECHAYQSRVVHEPTRRSESYGALASAAATLPVPQDVPLKDARSFRLIGTPVGRVDSAEKVDGSAVFGIDVRLPDMLTATILHCPVFGGEVASVDARKALAVDGVHQVFTIDSGVAVVAADFWAAHLGRKALDVKWDFGSNQLTSSAQIGRRLRGVGETEGKVVREEGDLDAALSGAAHVLQAQYETSFQAHATMEPMCCTAQVRDNGCEIWAPTQQPTSAQREAAKQLGQDPDSWLGKLREKIGLGVSQAVVIHTTLLGGGFGRRNIQDFVAEAVQIAKRVNTPVKLIWPREEDIQHDYYNPATYQDLKAVLGEDGMPMAWYHRVVGSRHAGGAKELPYAIPNIRVEAVEVDTGIPLGPWRSVSHSYTAFAKECFVDELAVAAGRDALDYRLALLKAAPRLKRVLERAAEIAGWGRDLPEGRALGLAVHDSFGSYVAQVAEVSIKESGQIKVHRVTCAVDCGIVVNPDTVMAQVEGSIAFGLTAALKSRITIKDGRVEQSNFDDFPLLTFDEMPKVETVILPSRERPGGMGEPGVPPIAPAVANAVFAATGVRARRLPIMSADIRG